MADNIKENNADPDLQLHNQQSNLDIHYLARHFCRNNLKFDGNTKLDKKSTV